MKDTLKGPFSEQVALGWSSPPISPALLDCEKGKGQKLSIAYRFSCLLFPSREPSGVDGAVVGSSSDTDLPSSDR